jgi:hypothetical protein
VDFSTRAVADGGHLLRFRARRERRGLSHRWVTVAILAVTLLAAVIPAFMPGAGVAEGVPADEQRRALTVLSLLPVGFAGFLALAVVSAVASGGGRELLPRDQATPYPISPTTDHLGALLLAPVNTAWLLQAWVLVGSASYGVGPAKLLAGEAVVLLWLVVATCLAQVVAWSSEAVRRRRHGIAVMRTLSIVLLGTAVWLHVQHQLVPVLDRVPTVWFVVGAADGFSGRWLLTVAVEVAIVVGAVVLGVFPAHLAARRTARDELRVESETRSALPNPRSDLLALVRTDRSSVWRTVPMRRGILVLAIGPGLVAIAGDVPWHAMTILPGLVASGGALLFGVNAWCLDGRGGLWRESLPVSPQTVFTARAIVLAEFLLVASVITIVLASLRAGIPSAPELAALAATLLVVTVQVAAAGLRWSARRPFAVDLRSARATPAPPAVMVAYSTRLAISTTLTSLVFSGLARTPSWEISVVVAVPFLAWSTARLLRTAREWTDPVQRARVVVSVAA